MRLRPHESPLPPLARSSSYSVSQQSKDLHPAKGVSPIAALNDNCSAATYLSQPACLDAILPCWPWCRHRIVTLHRRLLPDRAAGYRQRADRRVFAVLYKPGWERSLVLMSLVSALHEQDAVPVRKERPGVNGVSRGYTQPHTVPTGRTAPHFPSSPKEVAQRPQ